MTTLLRNTVFACLACIAAQSLTSTSAVADEEPANFGIEIVPLAPLPQATQPADEDETLVAQAEAEAEAQPAPAGDPNLPTITPQAAGSSSYWEMYQSIPFLRSEYNANPSYRHEGTIELILKQVKPVYKYINVTPNRGGGVYRGSPYSYRRGQYYRGYNYPYLYYSPWASSYWQY